MENSEAHKLAGRIVRRYLDDKDVRVYRVKAMAMRHTSRRSLKAYQLSRYSQYAVAVVDTDHYFGGPINEVQKQYPGAQIIAQWSGGYRV